MRLRDSDYYGKRVDARSDELPDLNSVRDHYDSVAKDILRFSARLLLDMREGRVEGKTIFLGQGMRALFEATSGLNNAMGLVPKSRLRYFIYSTSEGGEKPTYTEGEAGEALKASNILDGSGTYNLVDTSQRVEGNLSRLSREIHLVEPRARVNLIDQHRYPQGYTNDLYALVYSDNVESPTVTEKTVSDGVTRVMPTGSAGSTMDYLMFQEALASNIEKLAGRGDLQGFIEAGKKRVN
ncbi:MAG: hypothetical protein GF416_03510 [Candidatus Altiarchaeales archaeon]|nr:hypothetical protein [Candidatus Altiarchaeales archaeon]MBD3416186.1 hypothetical protein [Candidatus Altiarchaeales archaeon]